MKMSNHQLKKRIITMFAVFAVTAMAFGTAAPIQAAETKQYKVSFKPGSQGTFASLDVDIPYQGTVNVDLYRPRQEDIKPGYYFTGWSPEAEGSVEITKQTAFVAQYAKIINKAVYRVNYVDTYGNPVFTQKVVTGEAGARIYEIAEPVEDYAVDAVTKYATVEKDGKTEITFVYTSTKDPNIVIETETIILPGGTPITTVGSGTGTTTPTGTATTAPPAEEAAPEADAGETETEGSETVQVPDEDVPLDDMDESDDGGVKESKDEEVPLANEKVSSNVWKYAVAGGAVLILLAAAAYIIVKRKKTNS